MTDEGVVGPELEILHVFSSRVVVAKCILQLINLKQSCKRIIDLDVEERAQK